MAVVGAGPIGLGIAWLAALRGMRVLLHDPDPGSGASGVAAGMLSPVAEASFGEQALTRLLLDSAARWPDFAAEVAAAAGLTGIAELGYRTEGTLVIGRTADDLAEARRLWAYQQGLGLPITALDATELHDREPLLAPRVRGGAHAPDDHQVDPRRLVAALRIAAVRAGVVFVPATVHDLAELDAGTIVVAAGCGAAGLTGLPIRPVKGQILRLRAPGGEPPGFRHVIRGYNDGRSVYLVPRLDGEVVVGATVEERIDTTVTAGGVLELLRAATDLVPELAEYELAEATAGHRPGTPDNAPVIGRLADRPDVVVATGHYRHGILLTPVTAQLVVDLLTGGVAGPALAPFTPDRFTRTGHTSVREEIR
ncbi:glycine oxidase ThiO [Micromonospora sp. NPDC049523]|uniref:glycine oxidase ThiO n=1 Tax=Micromonospora sp. NPDC049523 TaxID=3155921 RepID=UPI00343952D6